MSFFGNIRSLFKKKDKEPSVLETMHVELDYYSLNKYMREIIPFGIGKGEHACLVALVAFWLYPEYEGMHLWTTLARMKNEITEETEQRIRKSLGTKDIYPVYLFCALLLDEIYNRNTEYPFNISRIDDIRQQVYDRLCREDVFVKNSFGSYDCNKENMIPFLERLIKATRLKDSYTFSSGREIYMVTRQALLESYKDDTFEYPDGYVKMLPGMVDNVHPLLYHFAQRLLVFLKSGADTTAFYNKITEGIITPPYVCPDIEKQLYDGGYFTEAIDIMLKAGMRQSGMIERCLKSLALMLNKNASQILLGGKPLTELMPNFAFVFSKRSVETKQVADYFIRHVYQTYSPTMNWDENEFSLHINTDNISDIPVLSILGFEYIAFFSFLKFSKITHDKKRNARKGVYFIFRDKPANYECIGELVKIWTGIAQDFGYDDFYLAKRLDDWSVKLISTYDLTAPLNADTVVYPESTKPERDLFS